MDKDLRRSALNVDLRELERRAEDAEREHSELARKWTQSTRYVNVLFALSEKDAAEKPERSQAPTLPKRLVTKEHREALLTAGLALLLILGAAFFAGLL